MDVQLLKDEMVVPSKEVLKKTLGPVFPVYETFCASMETDERGLTQVWKYYRDGKAWLCRICRKTKTVAWLSVWDGFFKVSLYFTEKTGMGIRKLNIAATLRDRFASTPCVGKLKPLIVDVRDAAQLSDLLALISYKISLG